MTYAIINGELLPIKEAKISIQDRGFRLGDGVFETIALHNGVPYQYDWHMQRLSQGLKTLKIPYETELLKPLCRILLHKNNARTGTLRIQITRGNGSRGYLPVPENGKTSPCAVIETIASQPPLDQSVNLKISSYKKMSVQALPIHLKLCQGLNSTLARIEAVENGMLDAIMLNEKNQICETSSANIFWIRDNKLFTPALSCGLLDGSTRAAIMRLYSVTEVEAEIKELQHASQVMLTNSNWGIIPVSEINKIGTWLDFSRVLEIQKKLHEDRDNHSQIHAPMWLIQ